MIFLFDFQGFLRVAHPKNTQYEYNGLVVESDVTVSEGGAKKSYVQWKSCLKKMYFCRL